MTTLKDLSELGPVWERKVKTDEELAAWRRIQDAAAKRLLAKSGRAFLSRGDRPICACGKIEYPSKDEARRAIRESGVSMRVYMCPLGHRLYHLQASGRSTREGGFRR